MFAKRLLATALLILATLSARAEGGLLSFRQNPPQHSLVDFNIPASQYILQKRPPKGDLLSSLGDVFGLVVATDLNVHYYKTSSFFSKPDDTAPIPYMNTNSRADVWLHLELTSSVINISYETNIPIWISVGEQPRFSKTSFNFFTLYKHGLIMLSLIMPDISYTTMGTRDYSFKTWDITALFILQYVRSEGIYLNPGNKVQKVIESKIYYLGVSRYLDMMSHFSRYQHIDALTHGVEPWGLIDNIPILPFFDLYGGGETYFNKVGDSWIEDENHSFNYPFQLDAGVMYCHDFIIEDKNMLIQPYVKWTLYPVNRLEARLSFQYVF